MSPLLTKHSAGLELKHFRSEACLSWLIWDTESRVGAMIDPWVEGMEEYRAFLGERGIRLAWVIDTRTHCDHFSATHFLAEETRAVLALSAATRSTRAARRLSSGDELAIGRSSLRVLETPGVAPDAICLQVDQPGCKLLFTGDTLWIDRLADTDLPEVDPRALHHAIHETIAKLDDDTVILPGHDRGELLFSTLGQERVSNPDLKARSITSFLQAHPPGPSRFSNEAREKFDYNLAIGARRDFSFKSGLRSPVGRAKPSDESRSGSISSTKYVQKLEDHAPGTLFIDVREPSEFADGHIEGTSNIPLSSLALWLPELRSARRIYLNCLSGRRSEVAARSLSRLGLADVVNVSGGFNAWVMAGLPVVQGVG